MSAILNNNDLRSEAKAYQRDKNQKTKWARGATVRPGQHCPHRDTWDSPCADCALRPTHRDLDRRIGRYEATYRHSLTTTATRTATSIARKVLRDDVSEAMDGPLANVSDTSSDNDEIHEASAAPAPDAEVMYSYDATRGPGHGGDVLSHAVTQALQRFENKETEKLVHKEYDLIDEAKEGYLADEDEEYEVIDHAHLN